MTRSKIETFKQFPDQRIEIELVKKPVLLFRVVDTTTGNEAYFPSNQCLFVQKPLELSAKTQERRNGKQLQCMGNICT